MSVIAAALKHMLAAGMPHDAVVAAVADMEAAAPKDVQAERRREKDRERKRLRKSAESAESAEIVETPSPNDALPNLETLEGNLNPTPLKVPPRKSDFPKDAFEVWYPEYPRHVARKAAEKIFKRIERSGEVSFAELMAGTRAYAKAVLGKEPEFIKHPATWLNGGCWADEHAKPVAQITAMKTGGEVPGGYWMHREDPRFDAWIELGHHPPSMTDRDGGWLFPSEFPPQMQAAE